MKRIKSMLINKLHRVCYESKDSPTADSFADDMKNFTEAFGHLDIHDNMIELAFIWTGDDRIDNPSFILMYGWLNKVLEKYT